MAGPLKDVAMSISMKRGTHDVLAVASSLIVRCCHGILKTGRSAPGESGDASDVARAAREEPS
eukprot:6931431-Prymnesium_polylepis.1